MSDQVAIYPGTFDPMTNGHLDIVQRACRLFDRLIVAVADHDAKKAVFPLAERVTLAKQVVADLPQVKVLGFRGLLVTFAKRQGVHIILRGMRAMMDFDYEFQMAGMNRQLYAELETVFLPSAERYSYLSSTMVKEIARFQGDVSAFVPPVVADALKAWYSQGAS